MQILAHIDHHDRGVFAVMEKILTKILLKYPHQLLWRIQALSRSKYASKAQRCRKFLDSACNTAGVLILN